MEKELETLRHQNAQLRFQKEFTDRKYEEVMMNNNSLLDKLTNLENVFIGDQDQTDQEKENETQKKYSHKILITENNDMRNRIKILEYEKVEKKHGMTPENEANDPSVNVGDISKKDMKKLLQVNEANKHLEERIGLL